MTFRCIIERMSIFRNEGNFFSTLFQNDKDKTTRLVFGIFYSAYILQNNTNSLCLRYMLYTATVIG